MYLTVSLLIHSLLYYALNASAEYGIIPMQTCVWYVLDDSDPDDASYINHKNGYLHFYGAGYGPDLYCTEFVNRSGTITVSACSVFGVTPTFLVTLMRI